MSQENMNSHVLKYSPSPYPNRATEKQIMFLNSLLEQGRLFESDFDKSEYVDATMIIFCRADQLIKLGLSRPMQRRFKKQETHDINNEEYPRPEPPEGLEPDEQDDQDEEDLVDMEVEND